MYRNLLVATVSLLLGLTYPMATVSAMDSSSGSTWAPPKPADDGKKKTKKKKTKKDKEKDKQGALDIGAAYALASSDVADGNYSRALPSLRRIVAAQPGHADAWNLIGFASRKIGELDVSWKAYQTALSIAPDHRGAHEYLGEWYLQKDDLAGALGQYRRLAGVCGGPCVEKSALERAIVAYSVAALDHETVKAVQARLAAAGFFEGPVDGRFTATSASALKAFQLARGIDEVGLFEKTRHALQI
jgi:tetratricopeptide (TPR) repeat protein